MVYKNTSNTTKTFYGVQFPPGAVCEVRGYINNPNFLRLQSMPKEPPARVEAAIRASRRVVKPLPPVKPPVEVQSSNSDNQIKEDS